MKRNESKIEQFFAFINIFIYIILLRLILKRDHANNSASMTKSEVKRIVWHLLELPYYLCNKSVEIFTKRNHSITGFQEELIVKYF